MTSSSKNCGSTPLFQAPTMLRLHSVRAALGPVGQVLIETQVAADLPIIRIVAGCAIIRTTGKTRHNGQ